MQAPGSLAEHWDAVAEGFDELVTPINRVSGEEALSRVSVGPGTRFLDVAAGSGALSLPAAQAGAEVLAVDFSEVMVRRLSARARKAGLSNLEARVMDGTALDIEDETFEVVASQHGVSLFPDMARGLAEMTRVTKPGGTVLISAFGPLEEARLINTFMEAVAAAAPDAPLPSPDQPPPPFQVADPSELARRLEAARLTDVQVETVTTEAAFDSPKHYWETMVASNPIGAQVDGALSEAQRQRAREAVAGVFAQQAGSGPGGVLTTRINIGLGTKGGA